MVQCLILPTVILIDYQTPKVHHFFKIWFLMNANFSLLNCHSKFYLTHPLTTTIQAPMMVNKPAILICSHLCKTLQLIITVNYAWYHWESSCLYSFSSHVRIAMRQKPTWKVYMDKCQ